jgi:hypothetical protein
MSLSSNKKTRALCIGSGQKINRKAIYAICEHCRKIVRVSSGRRLFKHDIPLFRQDEELFRKS